MAKITPGPWAVHFAQTVSIRPRNSDLLIARLFGARAKAEANARLIARSPSMLALLEKALPIIEVEAGARENAMNHRGKLDNNIYWTEMRELANEIEAEMDRAKGKEITSMVEPNGGYSTCPICNRHWLVTPSDDCFLPACACFGSDTSQANPSRPCEKCGLAHIEKCNPMFELQREQKAKWREKEDSHG